MTAPTTNVFTITPAKVIVDMEGLKKALHRHNARTLCMDLDDRTDASGEPLWVSATVNGDTASYSLSQTHTGPDGTADVWLSGEKYYLVVRLDLLDPVVQAVGEMHNENASDWEDLLHALRAHYYK
ncbi:MAG: hypothetical protein ACREGJ_02360 [Candidatus Saccharimonadales bacterium]